MIPQKKDYKHRPISLYYYRKLFQDVVKDVNGQNLYVLNQLGIDYKVSQLEKRLAKLSEKTENNFRSLIDNPSLYSTMVESDVNVDVDFDFSEFKLEYDLLDGESKNRLFRVYSEYKLVYQYRFFEIPFDRHSVFYCLPRIDVVCDYKGLFPLPFTILPLLCVVLLPSLKICLQVGFRIVHTTIFQSICAFLLCLICAPIIFLSKMITNYRLKRLKEKMSKDSMLNEN